MLHSNHVFEKNSGRKIEAKRKDIEALKFQLVEAQSFLLGMEEALKFVPEDDALNGHNGSFLRPGTDLAKSREAILNSGRALHINEILKAIGKEVGKRQRVSLAGNLSYYAKGRRIFTKTAPATYGLIELEKQDGGREGTMQP